MSPRAIQAQNAQVAVGPARRPAGGARPAARTPPSPRRPTADARSSSRNIVLRSNTDGSQVRLRDVARVELGAAELRLHRHAINGKPASGMAITLATGANALDTVAQRQGD